MGRDAPFGHETVEAALSLSSIAAAFSVVQLSGFENYDLIPANWLFMGICSAVSLVVLSCNLQPFKKSEVRSHTMKNHFQRMPFGLKVRYGRIVFAGLLLSVCLAGQGSCGARELDFLIDTDPELDIPQPVTRFNPELKTLWITALERPDRYAADGCRNDGWRTSRACRT